MKAVWYFLNYNQITDIINFVQNRFAVNFTDCCFTVFGCFSQFHKNYLEIPQMTCLKYHLCSNTNP